MAGPCTIDSTQLLCGSDEYNHGTFYNARVLACHTTVTELDSFFDDNYAGNTPETAMSVSPLILQWQNNNWHGLGFDHPFDYNGIDNLVLEFRWQGDDNNSVYDRGWYTSGNRACNASSSLAPEGVPRNYMPRFRIFYSTTGVSGGSVLVPHGSLGAQPIPSRSSVRFSGRLGVTSIYTAAGRLVRTLSGPLWDGCDEAGRPVASGAYVCHSGSNSVATIRILR